MSIFMFIYWQFDAKKRFKGPTPADEAALRKIEHDLAGSGASASCRVKCELRGTLVTGL